MDLLVEERTLSRKILVFIAIFIAVCTNAATGQQNSTWVHFSDAHREDSPLNISLSPSHGNDLTIEVEIPGIRLRDRSIKRHLDTFPLFLR